MFYHAVNRSFLPQSHNNSYIYYNNNIIFCPLLCHFLYFENGFSFLFYVFSISYFFSLFCFSLYNLKISKLILIFILFSAFRLRFSKYLDPIFIVAFYWLLYISVEGNFMLIDCVYILFFIALSPQISLLGRYSVLKQHSNRATINTHPILFHLIFY